LPEFLFPGWIARTNLGLFGAPIDENDRLRLAVKGILKFPLGARQVRLTRGFAERADVEMRA
jgi:hypothetical protein